MGGSVKSTIEGKPHAAFWLPNEKDDRFGRLFVTFGSAHRPVAVSRVLFADSFRAAVSVLWQTTDDAAAFRDGEILVLMSMDPESPVSQNANKQLRERVMAFERAALAKLTEAERTRFTELDRALKARKPIGALTKDQQAELLAQMLEHGLLLGQAHERLGKAEFEKAERDLLAIRARRGIVVHPALVGRELSWSCVRIDFALNDPEKLFRESAAISQGIKAPDAVRQAAKGGASTWQYFERDATISLRAGDDGNHQRLVVTSAPMVGNAVTWAEPSERSHFAISVFSREPRAASRPVEDGLFQRPDLEQRLQPMLDWLATNHHDFMRLNDFSESFSMLRWLRETGVNVTLIDMFGDRRQIATPDWIDIRRGPQVTVK